MKVLGVVLAFLGLCSAGVTKPDNTWLFGCNLTPSGASTASGVAACVLGLVGSGNSTLTCSITFKGLGSNLTSAQITSTQDNDLTQTQTLLVDISNGIQQGGGNGRTGYFGSTITELVPANLAVNPQIASIVRPAGALHTAVSSILPTI